MNKYIEEAQQLKLELDKLRPISKEQELAIMQKFRLDWNYHSNNLEGNQLTYGETRALLLFNITAQSKPLKDHLEVTGHNEAIKLVEEIVKEERPLTESFIRELHRLLLKEPYEVNAITPDGQPTKKLIKVGEYKSVPNHVKTVTGEIFRFATPEETPAKMSDLIEWYRNEAENEESNPIAIASLFHYKFIRIHPFDDGNGRTARLLMNFILMKYGYPPVIIKTEDKENYFAVLRQADAGIIEPFIEYMAKNLQASLKIMIKGAKGESIEEPDDIDKEISLLMKEIEKNKEKDIINKSPETVYNIINSEFLTIYKYLYDRIEKIRELFYSIEYLISINGSSYQLDTKHAFINGLDLRNEIKNNINGISCDIRLNSFTANIENEFSHRIEVKFVFYELKYSIYCSTADTPVSFTKLYSSSLSKVETNNLTNSILRNLINKVRENK